MCRRKEGSYESLQEKQPRIHRKRHGDVWQKTVNRKKHQATVAELKGWSSFDKNIHKEKIRTRQRQKTSKYSISQHQN